MKFVSQKRCDGLSQYIWREGGLMRVSEIRDAVASLRKDLVEVAPGMWVRPEMVGPDGTVIMERRVWEKLVEMAERLKVPASTGR